MDHHRHDKEVWMTAAAVLSHQRGAAFCYAEERAKDALDRDDIPAHGKWLCVGEAIRELVRLPEEEDALN